jgi:hypothetical protein
LKLIFKKEFEKKLFQFSLSEMDSKWLLPLKEAILALGESLQGKDAIELEVRFRDPMNPSSRVSEETFNAVLDLLKSHKWAGTSSSEIHDAYYDYGGIRVRSRSEFVSDNEHKIEHVTKVNQQNWDFSVRHDEHAMHDVRLGLCVERPVDMLSRHTPQKTTRYAIKHRHQFLYQPRDATVPTIAYDLCATWSGETHEMAEIAQVSKTAPVYSIEIECICTEYLLKDPERVIQSLVLKWFDLVRAVNGGRCKHELVLTPKDRPQLGAPMLGSKC